MSSNKHGFDFNFQNQILRNVLTLWILPQNLKLGVIGPNIHVVTETFLCEQNLKKILVGLNISFHY